MPTGRSSHHYTLGEKCLMCQHWTTCSACQPLSNCTIHRFTQQPKCVYVIWGNVRCNRVAGVSATPMRGLSESAGTRWSYQPQRQAATTQHPAAALSLTSSQAHPHLCQPKHSSLRPHAPGGRDTGREGWRDTGREGGREMSRQPCHLSNPATPLPTEAAAAGSGMKKMGGGWGGLRLAGHTGEVCEQKWGSWVGFLLLCMVARLRGLLFMLCWVR